MNPVRRGAGISKGTMRTAITVATQHNETIVFLSDHSVPIDIQKQEMKRLKGLREHPDFSSVELWESTSGVVSRVKFSKPTTQAAPAPQAPAADDAPPAPEKPAEEKPKTPKQPSPKPR